MSHRSHVAAIVIDVPSSVLEATTAFWGGAVGRPLRRLSIEEFHGTRLSPSLALLVQELGEGGPRVHIDVHTDDVDAEVARFRELGAEVLEVHDDWTIMTDPAGQPFCVVEAAPETLEGDDVTVWP